MPDITPKMLGPCAGETDDPFANALRLTLQATPTIVGARASEDSHLNARRAAEAVMEFFERALEKLTFLYEKAWEKADVLAREGRHWRRQDDLGANIEMGEAARLLRMAGFVLSPNKALWEHPNGNCIATTWPASVSIPELEATIARLAKAKREAEDEKDR